jgi:hypothetical protein
LVSMHFRIQRYVAAPFHDKRGQLSDCLCFL